MNRFVIVCLFLCLPTLAHASLFAQAEKLYNKALTYSSDGKGGNYSNESNIDMALIDLGKAIEINSNDSRFYKSRGIAYAMKDDPTKAIIDCNRAIELGPNDSEAYNNRAVVYYQLKEYDKAWSDVNKAKELGASVNAAFVSELEKVSSQGLQQDIEKERPIWNSNRQEVERLAQQGKAIIFKKFYLGMSIDEVSEIMNEYFKKNAYEVVRTPDSSGYQIGDSSTLMLEIQAGNPMMQNFIGNKFDPSLEFYVLAGNDKKVTQITIGPDLIDELFNTKGVDAEHFFQKFIESYHIPTMEPFSDPIEGDGWQYSSQYGFEVKISSNKILSVKKISSEKEQKFD